MVSKVAGLLLVYVSCYRQVETDPIIPIYKVTQKVIGHPISRKDPRQVEQPYSPSPSLGTPLKPPPSSTKLRPQPGRRAVHGLRQGVQALALPQRGVPVLRGEVLLMDRKTWRTWRTWTDWCDDFVGKLREGARPQ